jgi:hypothetical protein
MKERWILIHWMLYAIGTAKNLFLSKKSEEINDTFIKSTIIWTKQSTQCVVKV